MTEFFCTQCGRQLTWDYLGACPRCGQTEMTSKRPEPTPETKERRDDDE